MSAVPRPTMWSPSTRTPPPSQSGTVSRWPTSAIAGPSPPVRATTALPRRSCATPSSAQRSATRPAITSSSPLGEGSRTSASQTSATDPLNGDAMVAERRVEGRLAVGRLRAVADHERALELVGAGRELLGTGARNGDRAGRHAAAVLHRPGAGDVDHGHRRGQRHAGADHGLALDDDALGDDAPRAEERAVLDDHGPGAGRFQHAADADAAGDVDVAADLRPGA